MIRYGHTHKDATVILIDGNDAGIVFETKTGWSAKDHTGHKPGQSFPTRIRAARWVQKRWDR